MADRQQSGDSRDRYRDNDDVRAPGGPDARDDVGSDSRAEARGDARENVGRHARGTDADPRGPEHNDRQRSRGDRHDQYDDDLARDNQRGREGQGMQAMADDTRSGASAMPFVQDGNPVSEDDRHSWRQHARQGQAQSPVELNHNEPPKKKEGHR
ncbi:hypothetical protein [Roseisolibacter agri]|uniref:Uncharacterized protein n=1 Tax=Roseisolibacter agri TaxID=2014610 RepID=A0AA37Q959_9BACT|nr:hypothetical protein [Roseisolibacter agri]GLC27022.1 hypothetical protein rosag_35350 [Roseisolibacter agri]